MLSGFQQSNILGNVVATENPLPALLFPDRACVSNWSWVTANGEMIAENI
jgi:hypothetical protein